MKFVPLLAAFAVFSVAILALGLRTPADLWIRSTGSTDSPGAGAARPSLDAFVAEVGLDVSTMSVALRREHIIPGGKRSLPLCSLSPKQQSSQASPPDAFAESVAADLPELPPLE